MGDYLVELGTNPRARKAIKKLGLPLPMPQKLRRSSDAWVAEPLKDLPVIVCHTEQSELVDVLAQALPAAGANLNVLGSDKQIKAYQKAGDSYSRLPGGLPAGTDPYALILDGTGIRSPEDLAIMYEFFHNNLRNLQKCGRTIIFNRPPEQCDNPLAAAAARAMDGFNRAMSREIGKKGATSQIVTVEKGAEDSIAPALHFLLSERSAYINAQPIRLTRSAKAPKDQPLVQPLSGKVALVTGAARGIGAAIAKALAREGAHVICMDIPPANDPLCKLAQKIGGTVLLGDVTETDTPANLTSLLDEKFGGGIDIVIHNAGITRDKMLVNMKPEVWDLTLNVNLISLIRLNEALMPKLNAGGRIVCLSSMVGIAGNIGQSNYCASKAGLIGYVQSIAPALAKKGVTINAVCPGFIETQMTSAIPFMNREAGRRLSNLAQGGLPEDIAETATFLSSPGAAGVNGQAIRICGGNYVGA